ncbi:MAG: hypothetical protein OEZ59_06775 [Deltaproteobacteria bacterium]|nr:hypothetical protein [Deltaproteobacteria bacterium]
MKNLLAGVSHSIALGALRKLLDPLEQHWGEPEAFVNTGGPLLASSTSGIIKDSDELREGLNRFYQQIMRFRALYFRPIGSKDTLDKAFGELESRAAKQQDTLQQACLWLSYRIQGKAIEYLKSSSGQETLKRLFDSAQEKRNIIMGKLGDMETITMGKVNGAITGFVRDVMGAELNRIETAALSGHLVEALRAASRRMPDLDPEGSEVLEHSEYASLTSMLGDAVRHAELNDARQRFIRFSDKEKSRRFDDFRKQLRKEIRRIAPFAARGFEQFSQGIEAVLFPYPAPLEYIRAFSKPLFNNGRQSTLFSDTSTEQGVKQRYIQMIEAGNVNRLVLEIAFAIAMASFQRTTVRTTRKELAEFKLDEEFHWPKTVGDLAQAISGETAGGK